MPKGPESFGGGGEKNEADALKAEYQARGHEANETVIREKEKTLEKLTAEEEAIKAKLREANIDPDAILNPEASPAVVAEKAKKNPKLKKALRGIFVALAVSMSVPIGGAIVTNSSKQVNAAPGVLTNAPTVSQEAVMTPIETPVVVTPESAEVKKGIIDGYDKEGMWLSEGKSGPFAFADFEKVIEMHNGNVKEAIKYTTKNQVETMADFISALPNKLRPAGYENLSMTKTEDKIESLSDDDYAKLRSDFESLLDKATVKETTLNGKYDNAYMGVKDDGHIYGSKEAKDKNLTVDHESMQLIKCTTNEKGTKAYELTWTDEETGKALGTITAKGTCEQFVEKEGTNPTRFESLPEAVEEAIGGGGPITIITGGGPVDPVKPPVPPDPGPQPKPTPKPKPKDVDNLERIDDKIHKDIENDNGTGEVNPGYNPGVSPEEQTQPPVGDENPIVSNPGQGEEVQPTTPENNYGGDEGSGDQEGQREADEGEMSDDEAPSGPSDSGDELADLGIS